MNIPTLSYLESLARGAGEILLSGYGKNHNIQSKTTAIDLVTEMDHRSEAYLISAIQSRFPGHRIMAEENGETIGQDGHLWYIDPLDGTVNYAHHIPVFCVSIAYARQGQVELAVVYDPLRDECFSAELGRGAFLNGELIAVASAETLQSALLATGFPYDVHQTHTNLELFSRFVVRAQGIRRLGSAALDCCYVACGRLDGYWEPVVAPWDIAAGALIAREAGAIVTDVQGGDHYLEPPCTILTANPTVHAQMLHVIQDGSGTLSVAAQTHPDRSAKSGLG